ncbi:MAG: hypothetical protein ACLUE2_13515 [Bacteroides cellulosilyticus]
MEQFTEDENGNMVGDGGVHIYSNTRDLQILGSNVPDGILGINNTFKYRDFDLSVFAMIRYGQMIDSKAIGWYSANNNNQPKGNEVLDSRKPRRLLPRPGIASTTGIASLRYLDGSYAKIKNITPGIYLSQEVVQNTGT